MTHESFRDLIHKFLDGVEDEIDRKNHDYAGDSDNPFEAFDQIAESLGVTRELVWAIFYMKHVQALMRWVKNDKLLKSETVQSRLTDLVAYPAILNAMITDEPSALAEVINGL